MQPKRGWSRRLACRVPHARVIRFRYELPAEQQRLPHPNGLTGSRIQRRFELARRDQDDRGTVMEITDLISLLERRPARDVADRLIVPDEWLLEKVQVNPRHQNRANGDQRNRISCAV